MDGRWVDASDGKTFDQVSPATGEVIGVVSDGTRDDARVAIRAANRARSSNAGLSVFERAALCHRIADILVARLESLAPHLSLEQGKPLHEAKDEISFAAQLFRDAAENITRLETSLLPSADPRKRIFTLRQPHGVVAVLTPWNYPIGIPSEYLSAALAAGNSVVWKPAPTTSMIAARLVECLLDAGLPEGAVNLLHGGAVPGEEIVANPGTQAVGFTGSTATGNLIAKHAGAKPVLLELGGNGPTIILDDADLQAAIAGTAVGCFTNAGQICQSSERILVTERVHDRVLDGLVSSAARVKLGNPLHEGTTMGPLNNEGVAKKMDIHIRDAVDHGADVIFGGRRARGHPTDLYYQATVVDRVSRDSLANREETFGPIAPVIVVRDVDDAIAVANSCNLGLCASVYTSNMNAAFYCAERLECGVVNVNESAAYWDGRTPFGGWSGKGSGVGRLGGMESVRFMTQIKSVVVDLRNPNKA
ncbi:MAG: aldehyde dehydrogenase family protein [Candidatus Dormibacteraeota bacterium]|nr:aldehyde dehydrogenase family protein [Candidatus Dormibacteraeota bacterium]